MRTVYPRAFIFHMLIGHGEDITPISFELTWSKGKLTRVTYVKNYVNMVFAYYLENCLSQSFVISHPDRR